MSYKSCKCLYHESITHNSCIAWNLNKIECDGIIGAELNRFPIIKYSILLYFAFILTPSISSSLLMNFSTLIVPLRLNQIYIHNIMVRLKGRNPLSLTHFYLFFIIKFLTFPHFYLIIRID